MIIFNNNNNNNKNSKNMKTRVADRIRNLIEPIEGPPETETEMDRNFNYDEHDHEVYGGDIPDDAEMDADLDMSSGRADEEDYEAEPSSANSKVAFRLLLSFFPVSFMEPRL